MPRQRDLVDHVAYPPAGLGLEEAARYVGVGATLFGEMVADGRMPRPRLLGGRKVWLTRELETALFTAPVETPRNRIDELRGARAGA